MHATLLWACLASSALAQNYEQERQTQTRETEARTEAEKAASEAAKRKEAETAEVTYEQVLADPDNVDLNYRYARTQVLHGNLRQAAATLERILSINPDFAQARLFYAVVLFRLDDLDEAELEFDSLKELTMPEDTRQEINDYLRQIRLKRQRTQLNTRLGAGFEYDTNRNDSPSSGQRLFFGFPIDLSGTSAAKKGDTSVLSLGTIDVSHDLGTQAGHKLIGSLNYYRADQTVVKFLNLQAYSASLGATFKTPLADFTPRALFDHVLLDQETYLRQRGGRLQANRQLSGKLTLFAYAQYLYQDYVPTKDVPAANNRTGNELSGSLGSEWALSPTMRLSFHYMHAKKNALQRFDAYQREEIYASHAFLLGKGTFLLSSLTGQLDRYEQADLTVSSDLRTDRTLIARATFGSPLSFIARFLKDTLWTVNYEYYRAFSTITNYEYANQKISSWIIQRFDF